MSSSRNQAGATLRAYKALAALATLGALTTLGGCAVEWQNRQAAKELAEQAKPPGSLYAGWRVFQERCAGCHGADATGTRGAPDLLAHMREMGQRRFVSLVLQRYDWPASIAGGRGDGPAREALLTEIEQRRAGGLTMPAWQGEPTVQAHIVDLYAWLSARAQGTQGPGRPPS
ncbi:MAG: hypothetical protein ABS84_05110 [Rubrivivax sp. SCN 71-131]|jgi:hypothetical protein|nr:MAG: hypothetical protein ABS84_05110 [Rubrivivax sp. SCN 71-131]